MPADPKTSAGAREERRAFRNYLRRQLKAAQNDVDGTVRHAEDAFNVALGWVLLRQHRYDRKSGGLGK